MRAVVQEQPGGPATLTWGDAPVPVPGEHDVLIAVHATAFNPADAGTREGRYLAPGESPAILGLECAGIVTDAGSRVSAWKVGDRVSALLTRGGYAEYVAVHEDMVFPVPASMSLTEAAALPESLCTVWSNLCLTADPLTPRDILIHGGSGSVGSIAIQIARWRGDRVFTTVGSAQGEQLAARLGAHKAINYRETDFVETVLAHTNGRGVHQILDIMGAAYFQRNVAALSADGHLAMIGIQGGRDAHIDLFELLQKRVTITATMLKNRPETGVHSKANIVRSVTEHLWAGVEEGAIAPHVGAEVQLHDAAKVHEQHRDGTLPSGKTVLLV